MSKAKLLIILFFIPVFILNSFYSIFDIPNLIICGIILLKLLKKSYGSPLFFLFAFSILYYLPFLFSYLFGWQITVSDSFNTEHNTKEVGRLFFLFFFIIYVNLNESKEYRPIFSKIYLVNNNYIFYSLIVLSSFLLITALSGETILESTYGTQNKQGSSLYEYIIPIILIAYIFSGKKREKVLILVVFMIIYVVKDLLYGGRVSSIQMCLLGYLIFIDTKISFRNVVICMLVLISLMKIFEVVRQSSDFIINPTTVDLKSTLFFANNIGVYGSNEGAVVHSSIRLIGMINEGVISFNDRITSLFLFCFSAINPGLPLPDLADLASYLQNVYPCGGGGLFPIYFYIWGGYIGVIFAGWFIAFILNKSAKTKNTYFLIYVVLLLSTFPRWFAYNPLIIIKLCMFPVYLYSFLVVIHSRLKKKSLNS